MVEIVRGDLFDADVAALVNPVNCAGAMSRGLSLQFKNRFPNLIGRYKAACDEGRLSPGDVLVHDRGGLFGGDERHRYILNVATKAHWNDASALAHVKTGMAGVVDEVTRRGIPSLAVPPLGCGGGGLNWADVRALLIASLESLDDVRALVFAPRSADTSGRPPDTERPEMTRGRALLLRGLDAYAGTDAQISPHVAHNLAYLLQRAGADLHLQFEPGRYGMRASGLTAVLRRIEGPFIEGYDPARQDASFRLRPNAIPEAERTLAEDPDARDRLDWVQRLIDEAEAPEDLELLVTVDWIARHNERARQRPEAAVRAVHNWSRRKAARFSAKQIAAVWVRLRDEGWCCTPE